MNRRQHECLHFLRPRLDRTRELLGVTIKHVKRSSFSSLEKRKASAKKQGTEEQDSRSKSRLINLLGDDLLSGFIQSWGNVKRGQDGRYRDPVCRTAHETSGADAPSVPERDVGRAQGGTSSGEIAFRDKALRVRTYIRLVMQDSAGKMPGNQGVHM